MRNVYRISVKKPEVGRYLGGLGVEKRRILKRILKRRI
jgi:hypothetical protein